MYFQLRKWCFPDCAVFTATPTFLLPKVRRHAAATARESRPRCGRASERPLTLVPFTHSPLFEILPQTALATERPGWGLRLRGEKDWSLPRGSPRGCRDGWTRADAPHAPHRTHRTAPHRTAPNVAVCCTVLHRRWRLVWG